MLKDGGNRAVAEAYRILSANILFSNNGAPPRTILITSTGPKEGKSLTVANLGMALAQLGQKTLLIDADREHPMLHRVFNVDANDAPVATDAPNLSVVTVGVASGLVQSANLMENVR